MEQSEGKIHQGVDSMSVRHELRIEYLEKARDLLKQRIVSVDFFVSLSLALPESIQRFLFLEVTGGLALKDAEALLENVAGIVLTKNYTEEGMKKMEKCAYREWNQELYETIKKAGQDFMAEV